MHVDKFGCICVSHISEGREETPPGNMQEEYFMIVKNCKLKWVLSAVIEFRFGGRIERKP